MKTRLSTSRHAVIKHNWNDADNCWCNKPTERSGETDEMKKCTKCATRYLPKLYEIQSGRYLDVYDVDLALKLSRDLPVENVPTKELEAGLLVNNFDKGHLDHVNMDEPILFGIESPPEDAIAIRGGKEMSVKDAVTMAVEDGTSAVCAVFLDGSHRLARAARDGHETVKVRYLPEKLTKRCLVIRSVKG